MTAAALPDLAGALRVRPGGALPTIRSSRREWAPLLGRGRTAQALPDLLAAVYSLCGGAHRIAATLAVQAALGNDGEVGGAQRQALQIDTLREHLRRLWLDAMRLPLPQLTPPDPGELAGCPLLQRDVDLEAGRCWVEQQVLGQTVDNWLAGWSADPAGFAGRWARCAGTWPARWLAALRQHGPDLNERVLPLHAHASALELRRLARQLRHQGGFALAPSWRGHTAETGCWTRLADTAAQGADSPYAALWLRQAARVADIARLLAAGGACWLALGRLAVDAPAAEGAAGPGAGEGLGWCEMARGLLLHWVRLDEAGLVLDCRLIAPTEWNFHPFGSAARVLARLSPDSGVLPVQSVVAAYDPCVAVEVVPGEERNDA